MQEDSIHHSNSEEMIHNPPVTEESPTKCIKCSFCRYYFKSKVYLFEHLNKEHFLNVDAALKAAGLKQHGTNNVDDTDANNSGDSFKCKHCDFKACHQDILDEHEKECQQIQSISESPKSNSLPANQQTEISVVENIAPVFSIISTSKPKCTPNSSKDIKTYKRPLQTITKYLAVSSGGYLKTPEKSVDGSMPPESTKGTLILQESPSNSSPNSSGVFKVTAKPTIDMFHNDSTRFLLDDHLRSPDLRPPKPKEQTDPDNDDKRTNNEISAGPPAKKAKSNKRVTNLPEEANASKQQLSNGTEFSFEFSEDEDDKMTNLANEDGENLDIYFCKHCDYSDVGIRRLSFHYQNDHPYIRYNTVYIQNSSDQSATFRCLECPVDFLSVAALKRHYTENHPEAPNIFTMQSHELNLVYKCFQCHFTTNAAKALNKHFKEEHPMHHMANSLLYCRYSSRRCQDGLSPLNAAEKMTRPGATSPQNDSKPCRDFKNTVDHPPSQGTDGALYQCKQCNFSHKSVVVLQVHYQKSHPNEAITIDKIKQSAQSTILQTHTSQSTVITIGNPTPPKDISNSSKNTSDYPLQTMEKTTLSLKNPKHMPEASKTIFNKVESEERSKGKKLPTTQESEMSTSAMEVAPCRLRNKYYYCQHCSYSSINSNSVFAHHKAKHAGHPLSMKQLLQYSHEMQQLPFGSEAEVSSRTVPGSNTCGQVKNCSDKELLQKEDKTEDASKRRVNPFACAENLFYCLTCNMGNTTITGVMNHQRKVHRNGCSREDIFEYSVSVQNEIKKSKSQAKELPFSTHLPLPILNEGDECKFFCYLCNYRHSSMEQVMKHYQKRHIGFVFKSEDIREYTALVCRQSQKGPSTTSPNKLNGKDRVLHCHKCSYNTQYLYLLKRHLWKIHKANCSVTAVLRQCFNQGDVETGYHCDLCVFSHESASAVHEHFLERHPKRKLGLSYINARLYIGPETSAPKKRRLQIQHTDSIGDSGCSVPSQRTGQNEPKSYSCKACSFKGNSVSSITAHYRAVHPWSVKEDGSVLDVTNIKRASANRQAEDHNESPGAFDTDQVPTEFESLSDSSQKTPEKFDIYQVPLELDISPGSSCNTTVSSTKLKCPFCSARFNTKRGLDTHCGLKHRDAIFQKQDEEQTSEQTKTSVHLFKCPYCTYVNTSYHGVLTHCQMKHPSLVSYSQSLNIAEADLDNWGNCVRRRGSDMKICGYMCKICPQMCETREKLKKHKEKHQNGMSLNTVGPTLAPKPSALSQKISMTNFSQGSVSKVSFLCRKKYAVVKCQQCTYQCTTNIALRRHLLVCKKSQDCLYQCTLCSNSYYTKKRLGNHYLAKHGEESFVKHCAPLYKQAHNIPEQNPLDCPSTQQQENTSRDTNTINVYKCPSCTYVNASFHGTLTHCQMQHPDIIARADALQTEKILQSNMVGYSMGRNANQRGFMCTQCPQIHVSLKKLKIHFERDHIETKEGPPEYSVESENGKKAPSLTTTENDQMGSYVISELDKVSIQTNEPMYKCNMCTYVGGCRKYLHGHYRKTHKLDSFTTYKLLEKYQRRKRKFKCLPDESKSTNSCKMCPDLLFDSPQLLIAHYHTSHKSDSMLDFTILSVGSRKTTGLYNCVHCKKQMNGIRKLAYHLDRHRQVEMNKTKNTETRASVVIATTETTSTKLYEEDQTPTLETVEEQAHCNVTPVETLSSPSGPNPAPSKLTFPEQTELTSREVKYNCNQCFRTFMSLKGLATHKRSHAALAALKKMNNISTSALNRNINDYVRFKPGTLRPFLCSFCPFRTTVMGLWKRHFLKKHPGVLMKPIKTDNQDEESSQREDKEPCTSSEELSSLPELDEEPEIAHDPLYLEPQDVQRQLNHYNLMAQANAPPIVNVKESRSPEGQLLHCDLCNFNSGYLSSLRRHYMNRHGKKILTCKDCSFFTASRKTLEMHINTYHTVSQPGPTPQNDFHCPFCLYQTKTKNYMIDHIVLHRDERVVPIEVRRPKLSRYLEGIVFRCHKCTFTSGSAENLRLHMIRHNDDVKPYKCRLCFFDCTQLSDLEAHLTDKHQVLRNHELVGQFNPDLLEARGAGMAKEEEKPLSDLEGQHRTDGLVKTEEMVSACDEVSQEMLVKNLAEDDTRESTVPQMEEANWKQGQDCRNNTKDFPARSFVADHQDENALPNTAFQEKREKEDSSSLEKPMQVDENQAQPKLSEDCSTTAIQQKVGEEEECSTTDCSLAKEAQDRMMDIKELQQRTSKMAGLLQDDKLPQNSQLDEGCVRKLDKTADQDRTVEMKKNNEATLAGEGSITLPHNVHTQVNTEPVSAFTKKDCKEENNIKSQESSRVDLLSPNCAQPNILEEQVQNQSNSEELNDSYGEMPVLENEYLKGESCPLVCGKEDDNEEVKQEGKEENEIMAEDESQCQEIIGIKGADNREVCRGAPTEMNDAAQVPCPTVTEEKRFTCQLCGRNLANSSELRQHEMRHKI